MDGISGEFKKAWRRGEPAIHAMYGNNTHKKGRAYQANQLGEAPKQAQGTRHKAQGTRHNAYRLRRAIHMIYALQRTPC